MKEVIQILQILVSIFLIVSILLQPPRRYFGPYFKRRGFEKIVFYSTIFFGACFIILAILNWVV
jgi:preprotein translocase subunit SecG